MAIKETAPEETSNALVLLGQKEPITPALFFRATGSDAILATLKEEVRRQAAALDISTEKGRKAIASLAHKVARSKTFLDDAGKDLVADKKAEIAAVDAERLKVRTSLDELKEEVRKPLTDWENEEAERVEAHKAALQIVTDISDRALSLEDPEEIKAKMTLIDTLRTGRIWQEFKQPADAATSLAYERLQMAMRKAEQRQAEQAELERLRKEDAERRQREHDLEVARIAREEADRVARENARRQAEEAERERQRIENERLQAEARARQAEADRQAAEERHQRELQEAETRRQREAEQAEQRRMADELAAKRRQEEADERAARELEAAVAAERQRQQDEQKRLADEALQREHDEKNRLEVNAVAEDAMMVNGAPNSIVARKLVAAIAAGRIPNVTITY